MDLDEKIEKVKNALLWHAEIFLGARGVSAQAFLEMGV